MNIQNGDDRLLPTPNCQSVKQCLKFSCLARNILRIGAMGGFASGPAFGLVRWELWQILAFWFFWAKPKEQNRGVDPTNLGAENNRVKSKNNMATVQNYIPKVKCFRNNIQSVIGCTWETRVSNLMVASNFQTPVGQVLFLTKMNVTKH